MNRRVIVLIFSLIILLILNLITIREEQVYYQRVGKVWGIPLPMHFSYKLNNGSEIIEGWYIQNIVFNFIIYVIVVVTLMFFTNRYLKINKEG